MSIRFQYSLLRRYHSSLARCVVFEQTGSPAQVLRVREVALPALTKHSVHIRMLAFPINPADINQIEGVYPIKAHRMEEHSLWVPGNEGVAQVVAVGDEAASHFTPGDWVLPAAPAFGTWRTEMVVNHEQIDKLPRYETMTPLEAATLSVNPCTAYRMLKDFANLESGDVVLQNGANSAVGQAVIQIAHAWGLRTMNVIRDRPDFDQVANQLKAIGADWVVRDTEIRNTETQDWLRSVAVRPPLLALNGVGGKSAQNLARLLGVGGTIVTYGAMSRQPVNFPASAFIFKDLIARGYWMSRWTEEKVPSRIEAKRTMLADLVELLRRGQLTGPRAELTHWGDESDTSTSLTNLLAHINKAGTSMAGQKQVIMVANPTK
ncbi:trans-2-enoyl-CoA reductase [Syncephalis plumigaleata]|nr:trans-2-enoyl-CoA reductase [Syncephalis plumigaleata]